MYEGCGSLYGLDRRKQWDFVKNLKIMTYFKKGG